MGLGYDEHESIRLTLEQRKKLKDEKSQAMQYIRKHAKDYEDFLYLCEALGLDQGVADAALHEPGPR